MLVCVNGRYQAARMTGVQRYAQELITRMRDLEVILPEQWTKGIKGHLWEQSLLPKQLQGRLLWSPCNTGPLSVKHQVVTIHDLAFIDHPEGFSRLFARWYRYLIPRLARRARKVITVSRYSAQRIQDVCHVPAERIEVIYNGVDPRFHVADATELAAVRAALDLPERFVLCVGSLEPRKNLRRLLAAWESLAPTFPDHHLVLAGAAGSVFRAAGIDPLPPRVRLAGYVTDEHLPSLYSAAEAFVYPSLYEGFGLTVLEAMTCGTPVVCSKTTSLPEVAGSAAEYVDPLQVESIIEALRRVLGSEGRRSELRAEGLQRANQFSWDQAARQTSEVLQAAC